TANRYHRAGNGRRSCVTAMGVAAIGAITASTRPPTSRPRSWGTKRGGPLLSLGCPGTMRSVGVAILPGGEMHHKLIRVRCNARGADLPAPEARVGQVKRGLLLESRPVRFRRSMKLARWLLAALTVVRVLVPAVAQAQVNVT